MNVISTYKYAHISAFKAREVTREIQGLPVSAALDLLAFTPRKAAALILKTLKSAIANAENNNNLRAEALVVREAVVGEGPTIKRFQPKARGSAGPIRKRSSHIRIIVTDEIEIKTREPKKPARKKTAGAPKSKSPQPPAEPTPEPAAETTVPESSVSQTDQKQQPPPAAETAVPETSVSPGDQKRQPPPVAPESPAAGAETPDKGGE
jgi:large subunit ribosomal protein L22